MSVQARLTAKLSSKRREGRVALAAEDDDFLGRWGSLLVILAVAEQGAVETATRRLDCVRQASLCEAYALCGLAAMQRLRWRIQSAKPLGASEACIWLTLCDE